MPPTALPRPSQRATTPTPRARLRGIGRAGAPRAIRAGVRQHPAGGGARPPAPVGRPTGSGGRNLTARSPSPIGEWVLG
eukprot:10748723-Alexandrium_andersonii.AAC.1